MIRVSLIFIISLIWLAPLSNATWRSEATDGDLRCEILEPTTAPSTPKAQLPVIIYLENLASPRVGTELDETIISDFRAAGYLVVTLDFAHHPKARVPFINRDLVALRQQLQKKTWLTDHNIDALHIFIVPSGHRLQRDVIFFRTPTRTLAMDIIYPSRPTQPVGAVLEFSCDNANRMSNFSLDFCTDTILPAAAIEGFAVAMADHPVAAPYQGLDAMPDVAYKIKAAIRTLRAQASALDLNQRIVPVGFSRGSGMSLMTVTTAQNPEFNTLGEHLSTDSSVQGAVIMSGRFTYLDLLENDHMIPRYNQTWGPRASHEETWRAHGAIDYLSPKNELTTPTQPQVQIPPLFLTINVSEGPDALHQMDVLRQRLTQRAVPFTYQPETEPRGHHMPLAPAVLEPLFSYLHNQLSVAPGHISTSQSVP